MGERATTGVGIFEMIDREDANAVLDRRRGVRPPPVTVDELKAFMSADGAPLSALCSMCANLAHCTCTSAAVMHTGRLCLDALFACLKSNPTSAWLGMADQCSSAQVVWWTTRACGGASSKAAWSRCAL